MNANLKKNGYILQCLLLVSVAVCVVTSAKSAELAIAGGVVSEQSDTKPLAYEIWLFGDLLRITADGVESDSIAIQGENSEGVSLSVSEDQISGFTMGQNLVNVVLDQPSGNRSYSYTVHLSRERMPVKTGDQIQPSIDCYPEEDDELNAKSCPAFLNGMAGVLGRWPKLDMEFKDQNITSGAITIVGADITLRDPDMEIDENGVVVHASGYQFAVYEDLLDKLIFEEVVSPEQVDAPVVKEHVKLSQVAPIYPRQASRRGIQGWVELEYCVTAEGKTSDVKIVKSSPPVIFDRSAVLAVYQSRYEPRTEDGVPVEVCGVRNKLDFKLQ